jgi:hypothetical protein
MVAKMLAEFLRTEDGLAHTGFLMAAFGFVQYDREVPSAKGESLFDVSDHGYLGTIFGGPIVPSDYPHDTSAVVNLERSTPQRAKRIRDASGNADLFARVAAGILVQFGDADARRTSGQ